MPDNTTDFSRNMANNHSRISGRANFNHSDKKSVVNIVGFSFHFQMLANKRLPGGLINVVAMYHRQKLKPRGSGSHGGYSKKKVWLRTAGRSLRRAVAPGESYSGPPLNRGSPQIVAPPTLC